MVFGPLAVATIVQNTPSSRVTLMLVRPIAHRDRSGRQARPVGPGEWLGQGRGPVAPDVGVGLGEDLRRRSRGGQGRRPEPADHGSVQLPGRARPRVDEPVGHEVPEPELRGGDREPGVVGGHPAELRDRHALHVREALAGQGQVGHLTHVAVRCDRQKRDVRVRSATASVRTHRPRPSFAHAMSSIRRARSVLVQTGSAGPSPTA